MMDRVANAYPKLSETSNLNSDFISNGEKIQNLPKQIVFKKLEYALKNYISRGMKIFKSELINVNL